MAKIPAHTGQTGIQEDIILVRVAISTKLGIILILTRV